MLFVCDVCDGQLCQSIYTFFLNRKIYQIEFKCGKCKKMVGNKTAICKQQDGYFKYVIKGVAPEPLRGSAIIHWAVLYQLISQIEFECKECKRMIGDKTGVCEQKDGYFAEWTIKPPKCERKKS